MNKKDYCDFDASMALKSLGYNQGSDYTYCNHCRVSNEMLEKHPGLTDSGYQDLIAEYGGPYKLEEVYKFYIEPVKAWTRNTMIDEELGEFCSCVPLYDAQQWLREKGFDICIDVNTKNDRLSDKYYTVCISYMSRIKREYQYLNEHFNYYEEALLNGIKETLKILKEDNNDTGR